MCSQVLINIKRGVWLIIERSSMESPYARNEKPPPKARVKNKWCPDPD